MTDTFPDRCHSFFETHYGSVFLEDSNFDEDIRLHQHLRIEGDDSTIKIDLNGNEKLLFDASGTLRRIYLTEDTAYLGLTYKGETWLALYPSGNVWLGHLAYDQVYEGVKYKGLNNINFWSNGTTYKGYLAENHTAVIGINVYEFLAGEPITYYKTGEIQSGYQSQVLGLIAPYSFTLDIGPIAFYKSGLIANCISFSSQNVFYKGVERHTAEQSAVTFWGIDNRGQSIQAASFETGTRMDNFELYAGSQATFFKGAKLDKLGHLKSFVTPVLLFAQDLYAQRLTEVTLYENGVFESLTAGRDFIYRDVQIYKGALISLYNSGQLRQLFSEKPLIFNGKTYAAKSTYWFDQSGKLECVMEYGSSVRVCFN